MSEDCESGVQASGSAAVRLEEGMSAPIWIDRLWKFLVTGVLYVTLFREEVARLWDSWTTAQGSHGLLIPAFSMYFLYQDRVRLRETLGRPNYLGLLVIMASLMGYVYTFYKGFYYPRQIMMLVSLVGIVLLLGGWSILKVVWLPVAYLIFAMPLPARLYYNITIPMRKLASVVAAAILNVLPGVTCQAEGIIINGTHGVGRAAEAFNLNVAEACSGMRLLMAFLALGVAMAYLEYRPVVHRAILVCSTIPIAILCNMLRVLLTGLIYIYLGGQYAKGMLHTVLGMLMLVVAFALYGLLAKIMNRIYVDEDQQGEMLIVGDPARPAGESLEGGR